MPHSCSLRAVSQILAAKRGPTVCIVDCRTDDYAEWNAQSQTAGVNLRFVNSDGAALRLCRNEFVDLWVINIDLPGGGELCSMLHSQSPQVPVFLVAEGYSEDRERSAY